MGSKRKAHIYAHIKTPLLKLHKKTSCLRIFMFNPTAPTDDESQLLKNLLLG